ncbi:TlpA family protein disulfide reductase [Dyadobacter sp. CY261]|uniref:TlpA family protein disulfide reductase n=1 Tax=Dyadobacter sp. CY261 TaxID=2907203 RepID=UPI001F389736|nr:TlpA disulfide reductase family protein [Dyadobacter sp. CY261]MCF0074987.1 TlpA family protein disulfide reductase [Dyadobacter sp. CY261]
MKLVTVFSLGLLFLACQTVCAQDAHSIIAAVKHRQQSLTSVSYTLQRTDTLVTGDTRSMTGKAIIEFEQGEGVLGFRFWAQRDGFNQQTIVDDRMGYVVDTLLKTYKTVLNPTDNIFYSTTGGQMIVHDLFKLDTTAATNIVVSQDQQHYYLTLSYADLTEHDVTKRYKLLAIDKKRMLPVYVRKHQETLDKVQDLQFQISDLDTTPKSHYDFLNLSFLRFYKQEIVPIISDSPLAALLGKQVPNMTLPSFEGIQSPISPSNDTVILLDFWEVWCGPCIASMPKIQQLYEKFKERGLKVYGIIHEADQLNVSKKRVEKSGLTFPMLVGNGETKKCFHVSAIPLYVLIGRDGRICYLSEGFSDQLEDEIQRALAR